MTKASGRGTDPMSDAYWLDVQDQRVAALEAYLHVALEIVSEICATADEHWDGRDGTAIQVIGASAHEGRARLEALLREGGVIGELEGKDL